MIRRTPLLMLPLLAGCAFPLRGGAGPQPSQAAVAACNSRADEVFTAQNRAAVYRADRYATSLRDAPQSSSGFSGGNQGLSDQYDRGEDVRSCLNGVATPLSAQPAATAAP